MPVTVILIGHTFSGNPFWGTMTLQIMARDSWHACKSQYLPMVQHPAAYVFSTNTKTSTCVDLPPKIECIDQHEEDQDDDEEEEDEEGRKYESEFEGYYEQVEEKIEVPRPKYCLCKEVVRRMQLSHIQASNLGDIRYSFLIGGDGVVYEGRGWGFVPSLPKKYTRSNGNSIYIAYIGSYMAHQLPKVMLDAGRALVRNGVYSGFIARDFLYYEIFTKKVLDIWY